jgi:hypothetical protein
MGLYNVSGPIGGSSSMRFTNLSVARDRRSCADCEPVVSLVQKSPSFRRRGNALGRPGGGGGGPIWARVFGSLCYAVQWTT